MKITVIQCYAPTNDADPEQKDIFYETLQAEVENTPSQDLLIVMSDLNAMIGTVKSSDKSQIDHLLNNRKWRRSLQDVRVRRGADAGTDHHLVTAMVQLKLLCPRKTTSQHHCPSKWNS